VCHFPSPRLKENRNGVKKTTKIYSTLDASMMYLAKMGTGPGLDWFQTQFIWDMPDEAK